ncbi:MAG: primosomal protein N' [Gammaproteobacteria bacterium]|nr:MAG: primosomal protein N' [Gammaproteobacteria bacterium]
MSSQRPLSTPRIGQIAVPVPLSRRFDYLIPEGMTVQAGCRVRVPFARRSVVGVFCAETRDSDYAVDKLKPITAVLDAQPIISAELMALAEQASRYYHHPLGEVFATLLPNALAQGKPLSEAEQALWQLSAAGKALDADSLQRAPKQRALWQYFQQHHQAVAADSLNQHFSHWRPALKALCDKGLLDVLTLPPTPALHCRPGLAVNDEQAAAIAAVTASQGFQTFVLNGITGSGKTEVYLQLVAQCLQRDQQVLVLVPEIGLTPQLVQRFTARFDTLIVSLHSSMSDRERLRSWRLASEGRARIVIGTRSALFTALPELGLIIVDEEHDSSFKQQDSFRYHARDLAVMRAKMLDIPILMGSATPSMETLYNIQQGRYTELLLTRRAGGAQPPRIAVVDARLERGLNYAHALCTTLRSAVGEQLQAGNQVLLFLNRRGYAPMLSCPSCGWHAQCQRCDASLTLHQQPRRLICHHCAGEQRAHRHCPTCGYAELDSVGLGTQMLEQELQALYPDYQTIRIDRDSTRRKGALQAQLAAATAGEAQILLGTQMLAKGHHFPKVTLVGILDCDRGLFSADFRGTEQMAQLILQVAGRAGREQQQGHVIIQSSQPEHPLLHTLITRGYGAFSQQCLSERQQVGLPPCQHLALLRAESVQKDQALGFLASIGQQLPQRADVQLLGPVPAPMERRAGKFRAQLLVQSAQRSALHQQLHALRHACENSKASRSVRWSLDVDPMEMF